LLLLIAKQMDYAPVNFSSSILETGNQRQQQQQMQQQAHAQQQQMQQQQMQRQQPVNSGGAGGYNYGQTQAPQTQQPPAQWEGFQSSGATGYSDLLPYGGGQQTATGPMGPGSAAAQPRIVPMQGNNVGNNSGNGNNFGGNGGLNRSEVEQVHPSVIARQEELKKKQAVQVEHERKVRLQKQLRTPHVLFYSSQCPHCKEFFERVQHSERYRPIFKYFCVDVRRETGRRPRLPSFIQSVPTIIVDTTIYVGKGAFEWMSRAMKDTDEESHNHETSELDSVPSGYIPLEMNNWSDSYELLEDAKIVQESFFVPIDKRQMPMVEEIITPQEDGKGMHNSMDEYERERNQGIDQGNGSGRNGDRGGNGGGGIEVPDMIDTRRADTDYEKVLARRNQDYNHVPSKPAEIDFTKLGPSFSGSGGGNNGGNDGRGNGYSTKSERGKNLETDYEKLMAVRNRDTKKIERRRQPRA